MARGMMLLFLTALISGFSIFLNSFGVKGVDSSVFTFSKNIIVALLLFAIILGVGKWNELKQLKKKQWLQLGIIGLIGGSIPFLLFFKGLQLTTGKTSAFIHKTLFIYVAIFAILFLKEKLSKGFIVGALLLFIGNYFMIRPDFNFSLGHLLIIGATLFWAAENVLSKYVLKELSGTIVAFGRMFFGSLFIFLFLVIADKTSLLVSMTFAQYKWLLVTALLLLLYVFTFYNGLKTVSVSTATSILVIGSPITTLLSWFFTDSPLDAFTLLGVGSIVFGLFFILRMPIKVVSYERH